VAAHDVVFVGSGFPERVAWLSAIDWRGIDLGLYGHWTLKPSHPLAGCVRGATTANGTTAALYRRATLGLNLYREAPGAESLNPRAYELAACGVAHLSSPRREIGELFGDLVPQPATPYEAGQVIRQWLGDEPTRMAARAALPASVALASWPHRITRIIHDLRSAVSVAA
jgi:hypothetical protein